MARHECAKAQRASKCPQLCITATPRTPRAHALTAACAAPPTGQALARLLNRRQLPAAPWGMEQGFKVQATRGGSITAREVHIAHSPLSHADPIGAGTARKGPGAKAVTR